MRVILNKCNWEDRGFCLSSADNSVNKSIHENKQNTSNSWPSKMKDKSS